jgi:hypothetical protein
LGFSFSSLARCLAAFFYLLRCLRFSNVHQGGTRGGGRGGGLVICFSKIIIGMGQAKNGVLEQDKGQAGRSAIVYLLRFLSLHYSFITLLDRYPSVLFFCFF